MKLVVLERETSALERIKSPFPRISYDEAANLLQEKGISFEWGSDFGGADETALSEHFDRPVVIHRYPSALKAFYMKPDPEQPNLSLSADVLAPEGYGEIIGGGQRLDDYDLLLSRIKALNLPQQAFEWYLDLRRYGTVPHAGFGMGIERVVTWICGPGTCTRNNSLSQNAPPLIPVSRKVVRSLVTGRSVHLLRF